MDRTELAFIQQSGRVPAGLFLTIWSWMDHKWSILDVLEIDGSKLVYIGRAATGRFSTALCLLDETQLAYISRTDPGRKPAGLF